MVLRSFTPRWGESADALIERLVGSFHSQGKVYVATSDQAEQAISFGRGAYRLTPRELKEQVKLAKKESERFYRQSRPTDGYLENRLVSNIRSRLEKWRRQSSACKPGCPHFCLDELLPLRYNKYDP